MEKKRLVLGNAMREIPLKEEDRGKWYDVVNDYTLIECDKPTMEKGTVNRAYEHHTNYFNIYDELIYSYVKPTHPAFDRIVSNQTNHHELGG